MGRPSSTSTAAAHLRVVAAVVLSLALSSIVMPGSARAEVGDLSVGGRIGGSWALLTKPRDLLGRPTLLQGSAFSGTGLMAGASGTYAFAELPFGLAIGRADLLLAFQRGDGFAESTEVGVTRRREVELNTTMLRLPVLIGVEYPFEPFDVRMMVGPELLLGLHSGATVTEENLPDAPQPLHTRPTTHVGLTTTLGGAYRGPSYDIPFELRLTWDPFVPVSTEERFEGYRSEESPGYYGVGFDLYLGVTVGVEYVL